MDLLYQKASKKHGNIEKVFPEVKERESFGKESPTKLRNPKREIPLLNVEKSVQKIRDEKNHEKLLNTLKNLRSLKRYSKFSDEQLLFLTDAVNLETWKDMTLKSIANLFKKHFCLDDEFKIDHKLISSIFADFGIKRDSKSPIKK